MAGWNFADVWELVAEELPDAPAQVQGDRRLSWAEFDRRADGIASALVAEGLGLQAKVAHYLYNCPEYLESMFGMFKASLVPVNTNYRYAEDELVYLWDNSDTEAVIFHGTFGDTIEAIQQRVPRIRLWLWVDDGSGPCPDWAVPYEEAATSGGNGKSGRRDREGDDIYMLYTGGTTGMPKGVMWRQEDLVMLLNESNGKRAYKLEEEGLEGIRRFLHERGRGPVNIPGPPLMHGTGAFTAFNALDQGGCVVTLEGRKFDAEQLLATIERERVTTLSIVGDAFAKPILTALEANPGRWDITSLRAMISSGVMWSEQTKEGLLKHHPKLLLVDSFGSSEAVGIAQSVSTGGQAVKTAKFEITDRTKVFTDDDREVRPGSGEIGMLAVRGRVPVGYYKDPEKSERTFRTIGGHRWSIPGDYATVEADGSVKVLGRGSVCINTGGEKVYPEEVEEVLKTHPSVRDAVVVGIPDERFGEAITAVVETGLPIDEDDVISHVKGKLASYKAPKRVIVVDTIGRAANGKVDYKRLRQHAIDVLGA